MDKNNIMSITSPEPVPLSPMRSSARDVWAKEIVSHPKDIPVSHPKDIPGWRTNYIRTKMFAHHASKKAETDRRMSSIRGPFPPSPSSYPYKSMARELIELGKMYTDGLLTKDEFMKAKADLVN